MLVTNYQNNTSANNKSSNMKKRVILFSLCILLFVGCEKQTTTTSTATPTNSEESAIVAEQTFSDINTFADNFFSESGLKSSPAGLTCPTVSWNLASLPFSLVFDWGTGCTGTDGVLRKGKISISLTGLMTAVNSIATFTFDNYYAGGLKITGTHSITYVGLNSGNNWPRYQVATDARFDFPDGKFMTYHANYWRLLAAGSETATISDDVWPGKHLALMHWLNQFRVGGLQAAYLLLRLQDFRLLLSILVMVHVTTKLLLLKTA
jgi:hypothetical protein